MTKAAPTVDSIAGEIVMLERTIQPAECRSAAFQHHFRDHDRNPFFGWNPRSQIISNFRVQHVVLDGEFRGLINTNGLIQGTGYLLPDDFLMKIKVDGDRLHSTEEKGVTIIGCNLAHQNYFHWCSQALPAIDATIRREGQHHRITIALPKLNEWQEESLRLLGYDSVRRLTIADRQKQYPLEIAEFSQILNGGSAFALSELLYDTFTRVRQAVEKLPGAPRKLYVARTDAQRRVMRNEQAVIRVMQARGYEIVEPGALTFSEQVEIFRSASIIVGPHGAGMTNIVFCEPGTTVYELLSRNYTNACFCNLAMVCHLQYWADAFFSDYDADKPPVLRDWEVDIALLDERLTEIDIVLAEMHAESAKQTINAMDFLRGKPGVLPTAGQSAVSAPTHRTTRGPLKRWWSALFRRGINNQ